jgi:hypothetical protein
MESEPEIAIPTGADEAAGAKSYFGLTRGKLIILVIISAFMFGLLVIAFLILSKFFGLWPSPKKQSKLCSGCASKKKAKDNENMQKSKEDIEELDKLINENDEEETESLVDSVAEKLESNKAKSKSKSELAAIADRERLTIVEVKKDEDVEVDERTSYESSLDVEDVEDV